MAFPNPLPWTRPPAPPSAPRPWTVCLLLLLLHVPGRVRVLLPPLHVPGRVCLLLPLLHIAYLTPFHFSDTHARGSSFTKGPRPLADLPDRVGAACPADFSTQHTARLWRRCFRPRARGHWLQAWPRLTLGISSLHFPGAPADPPGGSEWACGPSLPQQMKLRWALIHTPAAAAHGAPWYAVGRGVEGWPALVSMQGTGLALWGVHTHECLLTETSTGVCWTHRSRM